MDGADDPRPFNPWQSPRPVADDDGPISDVEATVPWYRLEDGFGWLLMASLFVPPAAVAVTVIGLSGPVVVSYGGRPARPRRTWPAARNMTAILMAWFFAMPCCGASSMVLLPVLHVLGFIPDV